MSQPDTPLRILISGAGIAGPVCAYFLRLSHPTASITIIERAPEIRKEGQTIDVIDEGTKIFDLMGITERVKAETTQEKGLDFIDSSGTTWGHFPQTTDISFSREIEIVRGTLAQILWEVTKDKVDYVFDEAITGITQTTDEVDVEFRTGNKGTYDILIIADGLTSRTRALAFNQDVRYPIKSLNQYVAGFSLPANPKEGDGEWAKWYSTPGGRVIVHRPDGTGKMRTNFIKMDYTTDTRNACSSKTPIQQQKEYFAQLFTENGWDSKRLVKAMMDSTDFYTYEVGQVKMDKWSTGRIVMIGDAASCPSPISGQGTNVAITQAYVLAAMITKHPNNHKAGFEAYEKELRGWVEGIQKLVPGAPEVACPQSYWGVRALLWASYLGSFVVRSGLVGVLARCFGSGKGGRKLPELEVFGKFPK
jgi:2-polyprenyl-6-methoxyphenol hydroxylase-like FAD-dependent oxidoreductase